MSAGDEAGEPAGSVPACAISARARPTASRYHDIMTKQTTVRLPDELAEQAEAVARVRGTSVNALIINSLAAEIERVREDQGFTDTARRLLERDKELLERLAR
jgi:predicted transcriptional regulator